MRNTFSVFTSGDATISTGTGLIKQVAVKSKPYTAAPANTSQMNLVAVSNFDVTKQTAVVNFPHTGAWFDYYAFGVTLNVSATAFNIELKPGEFKLYTDVMITNPIVTGLGAEQDFELEIVPYPNPVDQVLKIESSKGDIESISMISMQGARINPHRIDIDSWDVAAISPGLYVVESDPISGAKRF